jgi:hypothetical protein
MSESPDFSSFLHVVKTSDNPTIRYKCFMIIVMKNEQQYSEINNSIKYSPGSE